MSARDYRGRLAPSPTGRLHLGHARTFWVAQQRAAARGGTLVLRNDDLDPDRSRPEFVSAMFEDLRWFGLQWQEGPDVGGPFAPYEQSRRRAWYLNALETLCRGGYCYPCHCTRKDVAQAAAAPHLGEEEPVYPGTCRPAHAPSTSQIEAWLSGQTAPWPERERRRFTARVNWRFQVPPGECIEFEDGNLGKQCFIAGKDFGDFVLWRHDDVASYQLATVADDAAMGINEVVRGADLLSSTARQWLLYRALGLESPAFYHCPLVTDEAGVRLAKRHDVLSLKQLREQGLRPEQVRERLGIGV